MLVTWVFFPNSLFPLLMGTRPNCGFVNVRIILNPITLIRLDGFMSLPFTSRWLHTFESQLKTYSWPDFCSWVLARFGRGQHELLIHQLLHIRQTTLVKDYNDRFSSLVDQLIAYDTHTGPLYFTMRFVDGLWEDIRYVVLVQ